LGELDASYAAVLLHQFYANINIHDIAPFVNWLLVINYCDLMCLSSLVS